MILWHLLNPVLFRRYHLLLLLFCPQGALFESPHSDENDVQTISHKCHVLSFKEYNRRSADAARKGQPLDVNTYYLAGYYDPTIGSMKLEPDVQ